MSIALSRMHERRLWKRLTEWPELPVVYDNTVYLDVLQAFDRVDKVESNKKASAPKGRVGCPSRARAIPLGDYQGYLNALYSNGTLSLNEYLTFREPERMHKWLLPLTADEKLTCEMLQSMLETQETVFSPAVNTAAAQSPMVRDVVAHTEKCKGLSIKESNGYECDCARCIALNEGKDNYDIVTGNCDINYIDSSLNCLSLVFQSGAMAL